MAWVWLALIVVGLGAIGWIAYEERRAQRSMTETPLKAKRRAGLR
jgi:uncharacterized BrkB/YihY/UPF0761 family membrane protein